MKQLLYYFLLPVYRPIHTLGSLRDDPQKLGRSFAVYSFLCVIYTLTVLLAYLKGFGAVVAPMLNIPAADYYGWQIFYQWPFFIITNIIFAGVVRLLSAAVKGKGTFEDIFSALCAAFTLPMIITMWIPETIHFIFQQPGTYNFLPVWLEWARQVIGIVWPLVIAGIGIAKYEQIKWYWAALFTIVAAIPMMLLMVIFIR